MTSVTALPVHVTLQIAANEVDVVSERIERPDSIQASQESSSDKLSDVFLLGFRKRQVIESLVGPGLRREFSIGLKRRDRME